jgi:peptidoglycan/LPS O-acetylase OafA/YrhL
MDIRPSGSRKASAPETGEIRALQYGRGIAALLVCLFHYEGEKNQLQVAGNLDLFFAAGHSGVEFFFVLSGCIILRAHWRDLDRPERLNNFYTKRAIRILPMFWLIVIPWGLAVLAISSHGTLTPTNFFLDLLLVPRDGTLTLPPAWTLQHELVFYIVFGFLVLNKRLGIVALTLWQGACLVVLVFGLLPQNYLLPATTFLGYYNFGFLFGIAVTLLADRFDFGKHHCGLLLGGIGLVGLFACFVGESRFGSATFPSPAAATLTYFGFYSLVIIALLAVENKPRPILDATLGALGAASYVLYIIHEPLYSVINKILLLPTVQQLTSPMAVFLLSVLVAVATSLAMHYGIERPVLRRLRGYFLPSRNRRQSRGVDAILFRPDLGDREPARSATASVKSSAQRTELPA